MNALGKIVGNIWNNIKDISMQKQSMLMWSRHLLRCVFRIACFIGVVPELIFCCYSIFLYLGRENGISVFACIYYPLLGPFVCLKEKSISSFEIILAIAVILLPLLLWRFLYKGKDRIVRTIFEIWFSVPWGFCGMCGYFRDCTSFW